MRILKLTILCIIATTQARLCPSIDLHDNRDDSEPTPNGNAGHPLILTPFLNNGSIDLAQKLSRVSLTDEVGAPSYAGFFTVDERFNSNLYFWYFTPFSKKADAPVVLWLQGGPGGSSLFGLFEELGPLVATKDGFHLREHHWALDHHLIFIDNPVGTGFSFTDYDEGYCDDEDCVAKGLYSAMQQFFTLFPDLRDNEFCITGESYAGKYIPALGMEIHQQNSKEGAKLINLKCLALGNAFCDPINQLDYGSYLYQHGFLDNNQLEDIMRTQTSIVKEIKANNMKNASSLWITVLSKVYEYTGFINMYNYVKPITDNILIEFKYLLLNDTVRNNIHVGDSPFQETIDVALHLNNDIFKSVAPYIVELLSHYRLMFYSGQLDIVVAYPLTENFLRHLNFSSAEEYKTATRNILWEEETKDVAGYYKTAGNLTEVLVRNAGHMVPKDQPKLALRIISRFIKGSF